jgi:biopolymer transport protein ExbB/TolQ
LAEVNPIMVALGVALLASVAGNALLVSSMNELRETAGQLEQARGQAMAAAQSCGDAVEKLMESSKRQRDSAEAAIEAARKEGLQAGIKAGRERNRPQAVPGNACESAEVETREWLLRRREVTP